MKGRIVEMNDTVRLRAATGDNLSTRIDTLARKARARAARESAGLACVFLHEDLDAVDSHEYIQVRERVQRELNNSFSHAHYVLPVWEIEAWLLLFPAALTGTVSSWSVPKPYRNRDTGRIVDPKGVLRRKVSSSRRRYQESDASKVLARAAELGCLDKPEGTNRSWTMLRTDADICSRHHIPSA